MDQKFFTRLMKRFFHVLAMAGASGKLTFVDLSDNSINILPSEGLMDLSFAETIDLSHNPIQTIESSSLLFDRK
jgi:Leucine-rich repeat (LRR) protein